MNRQPEILDTAQSRGRVTVDALAEILRVSGHTVRCDIKALCARAKLRPLHGGAEFIECSSNLPHSARTSLNVAAKQRIAARVARPIPEGVTLFFSIGTTPAVVAAALAEREALTVITNNLNAADFAIYGAAGIDSDGSLLDFHVAGVRIRRKARENARHSIFVADCSKFGRRAPAVGGHLTEADQVVTEAMPGAPFDAVLDKVGDRLMVDEDRV